MSTASLPHEKLSRVITVTNGKGGTGKTTTSSNIGGILASSGMRVLLVDLDPQGNIANDLGYRGTESDDKGAALATAIFTNAINPSSNTALTPLKDVRPNLDVIVGGINIDVAVKGLAAIPEEATADSALARALAPIADNYDYIFIDSPPVIDSLQKLALAAARWAIIPTRCDSASVEGVPAIIGRIESIRDLNPYVDVLGVVLFDLETNATRIRKEVLNEIGAVLGDELRDQLVFSQAIRHSASYALSSRKQHKLAHELETLSKDTPKWWEVVSGAAQQPTGYLPSSSVSSGLADDFFNLTDEIVTRINENENLS